MCTIRLQGVVGWVCMNTDARQTLKKRVGGHSHVCIVCNTNTFWPVARWLDMHKRHTSRTFREGRPSCAQAAHGLVESTRNLFFFFFFFFHILGKFACSHLHCDAAIFSCLRAKQLHHVGDKYKNKNKENYAEEMPASKAQRCNDNPTGRDRRLQPECFTAANTNDVYLHIKLDQNAIFKHENMNLCSEQSLHKSCTWPLECPRKLCERNSR